MAHCNGCLGLARHAYSAVHLRASRAEPARYFDRSWLSGLSANGAFEGLALLAEHPQVVLLMTDVVMSGMNGRKLVEEALRRHPDLNILFTTGYTRNAIVHTGTLDEGVELIVKPFTLEGLGAKVGKLLALKPAD
jgi:CheY-like chemotaxis protein